MFHAFRRYAFSPMTLRGCGGPRHRARLSDISARESSPIGRSCG
jgi:hypothetical protein